MDIYGTFMAQKRRNRTVGWYLPVGSFEGLLEKWTECIIEDSHSPYIRWRKNTSSLRRDIDNHAEVVTHSNVRDEVTIVHTRTYGQFSAGMSTALTNRTEYLLQEMVGEILETDSH